MAGRRPLSRDYVAFRLKDGTAYKLKADDFWVLINEYGHEIRESCFSFGTRAAEDKDTGMTCRDCRGCTYSIEESLPQQTRFAYFTEDCHGIPEHYCRYTTKSGIEFALLFIDLNNPNAKFMAVAHECAFLDAAIKVLLGSRALDADCRIEDFDFRKIGDFEDGRANPKDYSESKPNLLARIAQKVTVGIHGIFGHSF